VIGAHARDLGLTGEIASGGSGTQPAPAPDAGQGPK
jgi:hypothetical protein